MAFVIFIDGTGNNSDGWTSAQLQSSTTFNTYTSASNSLLTTSPNMTQNNFPSTNTMLTPENLVRIFILLESNKSIGIVIK